MTKPSWTSFNSSTLKKLLHEGLEENFSLKSSEIGLSQSELLFALLRRQRHFRYGAGTEASYFKFENQDIQESYSTSGFVTFDPDFWGKFKLRIEVGEINVQTMEISIESARLALAAAIAQVYTDLVFQTEVLRIREQQIDQVLEQKRLQKVKFNAGVITRLGLKQLEVDIESRLLAIEGLKADRNVLLERLSLLLGRAPASLQFDELELSMFQTFLLDSSESAVILRERPDINIAELSLLRSALEIEQAKAEYLPDLSLSLTLSNAQSKISELLKIGDTARIVSANLTETILDDGSRKTQVESSVLDYEIGLLSFKQVLLNALFEVKQNYVRYDSLVRQKQILKRQNAAQEQAARITSIKFKAGTLTAFDFIREQQLLLNLEEQELSLWREEININISYLQSIGVAPLLEKKTDKRTL